MRLEKILVPTDLSKTAEHALEQAQVLARRSEAELRLLHVVEPYGEPPPHMAAVVSEFIDNVVRSATDRLTAKVEDLKADGMQATSAVARHVAPSEAIADAVESYEPDLVVIGTHGRRGFRRFFLGSVAEKVLRTVPVPVLSVGLDAPPFDVGRGPSRALVPVDFSETSRRALDLAFDLVGEDGHVHVVHVVHLPTMPAFYPAPAVAAIAPTSGLDDRVNAHLDRWLDGRDASLDIRVGQAAGGILDVCEERRPDLVVMGNRGLTGVEHVLMGSVADRVVRRASVPVLTTH